MLSLIIIITYIGKLSNKIALTEDIKERNKLFYKFSS